jgi:AraC-like DNA-binding protein
MPTRKTGPFTLPTQHLRMALRMFSGTPEVVEALLLGSGVTVADMENPEFSLPLVALWPICENANAQFGCGWFLDLPILWSIDVQSEFGLAMRFAPSFAAAIELVDQYWHVRWPMGRAVLNKSDAGYQLVFQRTALISGQNWDMARSLAALNFSNTAKAIVGERADEISFQFDGPPPSYSGKLEALLGASVTWNNESASVFVPKPLLNMISPLVNRDSFLAMIDALQRRAKLQNLPKSLASKVAQILDNVTFGHSDAETVAKALGMSSRTMERHLAAEGRAFRLLAADSFKTRLEALVHEGHSTADTLAEQLGYHDGSSLMRACRRYLGKSLSQLRDELQARAQV